MNQTLCIPLSTAQKIAELGVKVESEFYYAHEGKLVWVGTYRENWREDMWDEDFGNCTFEYWLSQVNGRRIYTAYSLGELPAVLEAIGKVKGWTLSHPKYGPEWKEHFISIARLYAEDPKKGWEYLDNLLK